MYLQEIEFVAARVCLAEPGRIVIVGRPDQPLDDVLPYLATLPGVIGYDPNDQILTFRRQPGYLTMFSNEVVFTQVTNKEHGVELFEALVDAVNATWAQRSQLQAVTSRKQPVRYLDLFGLLPRTNCKSCGEATCMAFAAKLFMGEVALAQCVQRHTDASYQERRLALAALL